MNGVFYIGATGLQSQQRALDVVANNIANLNTSGFKRSEVSFTQLVGQAGAAPGLAAPVGEALAGVRAQSANPNFAQGDLRQTGNPAHVAIDGEGFIELMGPGGQTYLWRGGALELDAEGRLSGAGLPLKSMITAPLEASGLEIDSTGAVRAVIGDRREEIGAIDLVRVKDTRSLSALDSGLFELSNASDAFAVESGEDGGGRFVQGALESSNVELANEMIAMLLMQRAFAANAQVVQAGDQLMGIVNGLKR